MRWTLWPIVLGMSLAFVDAGCPSSWSNIKGKCFLFVNDTVEYEEAIAACAVEGGKLFEPMNGPSNAFMGKTAATQFDVDQPQFWIGITDKDNEGQ